MQKALLRVPVTNAGLLIALVPAAAIAALLFSSVWLSISDRSGGQDSLTLEHWRSLLSSEQIPEIAWNTALFVLLSVLWAMALGIMVAWLVERTDVGFRKVSYGLLALGVLTPNFFGAMAYVYLLHPRIGTINVWIQKLPGGSDISIDVTSIAGMAAVQGLAASPLAFVLVSGTLANMDVSLEGAGRVHGGTTSTVLRLISLPLIKPALGGTALFVAASSIATLDVPLIIGLQDRIYVFSTYLYVQRASIQGSGGLSIAAAFANIIVIIAVAATVLYVRMLSRARRYEVISARQSAGKLLALGRWRPACRAFLVVYFAASVIVPLVVLVWVSLLPYMQPFTPEALDQISLENYRSLPWGLVRRGAWNTGVLLVIAPASAMALSLLFSWLIIRSRYRWRRAFEFLAFLPHAVPNVIFAFAALIVTANYVVPIYDLYGSLALLVILYILVMLSFGTRVTNAGLIQIGHELEDAARVSGASNRDVMRSIVYALMRPTVVMGWLWLSMYVFRELSMAAVLVSRENITLPVVIYTQWQTARPTTAAAMTVLLMCAMAPLIIVFMTKFGVSSRPDRGGQRHGKRWG